MLVAPACTRILSPLFQLASLLFFPWAYTSYIAGMAISFYSLFLVETQLFSMALQVPQDNSVNSSECS